MFRSPLTTRTRAAHAHWHELTVLRGSTLLHPLRSVRGKVLAAQKLRQLYPGRRDMVSGVDAMAILDASLPSAVPCTTHPLAVVRRLNPDDPDPCNDLAEKPKGMHWSTYDRLVEH